MSYTIDWTTIGYSTTEHIVGTYDGENVYKKIIIVPANNNTTISVSTGVNIKKLLGVSANMNVSSSTEDSWVGVFYGSATDFFRYFFRKYSSYSSHNLEIRVGSGNAGANPNYIIEMTYTKN